MSQQSSAVRHKDLTWQQLRSFCEAARRGSLSAAATALDLAQPTVWAQVRALERNFNCQLLEAHPRGCRLTPAGQILVELAAPAVLGIQRLQEEFFSRLQQQTPRLKIATPPRTMHDEMPPCVRAFETQHPHVQLSLLELANAQVLPAVVAGTVDLGFTTWVPDDDQALWVEKTACYQLPTLLVVPFEHPLVKKKRVVPEDLKAYPFVNSPHNVSGDPVAHAALLSLGCYDHPDRRMEAFYVSSIRRYVELGFGLGLVAAFPEPAERAFCREIDLSRHFGRTTVYALTRVDTTPAPLLAEFVATVMRIHRRGGGGPARA
jgi:DNA-binding transcriptional LysR family regulator